MRIKKQEILGIPISAINYDRTICYICKQIQEKRSAYICVSASHLLIECLKDARLARGVKKSSMVLPDGMPLVWLLRLYGHKKQTRVYGPELMVRVCGEAAERAWRIFILGGRSNQSLKVYKSIKKMFPKLILAGNQDTPWRALSTKAEGDVIKKIQLSKPDIVFVGSGCPHQEKWMIENSMHVRSVLIGVGAAFDYITGYKKKPAPWTQNIGLEWAYRLYQDPKRLFVRYMIGNATFASAVIRQLIKDRWISMSKK